MNSGLILELSSEIAYKTMIKDLLLSNKITNEDDVIIEDENGSFYKEEYQDMFNEYYDFYYDIIKEII